MKKNAGSTLCCPLFALPSAGLLALMIIFPICLLFVYSFSGGEISFGLPSTFSLANYKTLFESRDFYRLMAKSVAIGFEVTGICLVISAPAAWAIAKIVSPARRNLLLILAVIPFFTSQLLLIYAIMVLFESKGCLMTILGALGLADPSASIVYTRACVVLILVYEYFPYMLLSLYSSFEQIGDDVIMASHTLGAGRFATFKNIVLPLSMPGVRTGILLVFVPAVGSFVESAVAGGPSGMMIGQLIDSNFSVSLNMCYGAAISLVFLAVLLILVAVINLFLKIISLAAGGRTA